MSYTTIYQCANDEAFRNRVQACMVQQAWNNETIYGTDLAGALRQAPGFAVDSLAWPASIDYEAEYESALAASNPDPGGDPSVITDGNILASVQTHWPDKPPEPLMEGGVIK